MMRFALYGDEAVVDHNFAKLKARFLQIPSVEVVGREARRRRVGDAAQPARARADRRAEPRPVQDGRLVGRRRRRSRRLLAGDPADRAAREGRAGAASRDVRRGGPRLPRRDAADQRAGDHVHQRDPVRHEEPGAGREGVQRGEADGRGGRQAAATASTARTCRSWTSRRTSSASTTTRSGGSTRRSRTRSTRTASSRPASRASGGRASAATASRGLTHESQKALAPPGPWAFARLRAPGQAARVPEPRAASSHAAPEGAAEARRVAVAPSQRDGARSRRRAIGAARPSAARAAARGSTPPPRARRREQLVHVARGHEVGPRDLLRAEPGSCRCSSAYRRIRSSSAVERDAGDGIPRRRRRASHSMPSEHLGRGPRPRGRRRRARVDGAGQPGQEGASQPHERPPLPGETASRACAGRGLAPGRRGTTSGS